MTHVIVADMALNDIGNARENPTPTAEDLIAAQKQLIERAHAKGLKIYGATLTPFEGAGYYTQVGETKRQAVNQWIRTSGAYDAVIDTQGLIKSALIASRAHGPSTGYDWASAREPFATLVYNRRLAVPKGLHAIERNRRLAAAALGYTLDEPATYALNLPSAPPIAPTAPYCVFVHGSSRDDKLWPEEHWIAIGRELATRGLKMVLPWGSDNEHARSARMATAIPGAFVPERLELCEVAGLLCAARLVVGVDTGLTHLAAASRVPVVGLYVGSDPRLTGVYSETWHSNLGSCGAQPDVATVLTALEPLLRRGQEFARICALYSRR